MDYVLLNHYFQLPGGYRIDLYYKLTCIIVVLDHEHLTELFNNKLWVPVKVNQPLSDSEGVQKW
jgi:hypothetical protein